MPLKKGKDPELYVTSLLGQTVFFPEKHPKLFKKTPGSD